VAALSAVALAGGLLTACGGGDSGTPTLTWYINPDSGGQAEIASRCTKAAEGKYRIDTALLPRESSEQRQQLVRRLAASDSSIDLMSLDPPFIPEFAEAEFLAPIPEDVKKRTTEGVVESAIVGSTWKGELVAVPFWANTQLLWYRKSVAEAAGLNMDKPVTWDQLIKAAKEQNKLLGVQGIRAEALTVWFTALIESAGGAIITGKADQPENVELGLDSEAAVQAATVMKKVAEAGVGGPALSTTNEDDSATGFESKDGGFQVNYPFVWPRAQAAVKAGTLEQSTLDDYGWATYPQTVEGKESKPPYGGINLGVGAFSKHVDLAYAATECITSVENESYYFVSNGNPASKASVYDDPDVLKNFPMAPVILESLKRAAPRPQTAYYNEVSQSIQRVYHPPGSIDPQTVGPAAQKLITAVLRKEQLL